MPAATTDETVQTVHIEREIDIAAPPELAFEAILFELGPGSEMPDGRSMNLKLEPWPGGRWFRDLGNNSGHLWGHIQVIKPPTLLELRGPFFMSYPAINFGQYRLTPTPGGTHLKVTHRAMGLIPRDHVEGMQEGWDHMMNRIREIAERRARR